MRFKVNKGIVKYKGVFHSKDSQFYADENAVKHLLVAGVVAPVEREIFDIDDEKETLNLQPTADMTIEELKKFLEKAEVEEVEEILQTELAKAEPRKTAVKLLEDWLKTNTETEDDHDHDDVQPPTLNADDVIVK